MNKTLRLLSVEDSEKDLVLTLRHLTRAGYDVVSRRVETHEAMKVALETEAWDVVLCDYSMPNFSALSALKLLLEMELDVPFIIISGTIGEDVAVEAMRAGAHDYLMKDKLARLGPTLERELQEAANRRGRRLAETSLRASEGELRALFAAMNDVILVVDAEGRHLKVAPTNSAKLYVSAEERIGKTFHDIFPKEKADYFCACVRRALVENQTQRLEYSLPIDGEEVWFEGSVSPMTPDSVIWIARDVTKRKHAERQLRLHATALQSAANAIVITDNMGVISWANTAFTTLTGYSLNEVIGQTPVVLNSGMHDETFYRKIWDTILVGLVWHGEIINRRKDGQIYYEEQTITPVMSETGEITNFIAIKQDITERKRAEEEESKLTSQIEHQRQRLINVVANVPGVVWEAWGEPDAATQHIDFVSEYVETMLGYSVVDWVSTPNFWLSIVHPDDRERAGREAAEDFAEGKRNSLREFRWVAKDGRVLSVQGHTAVIKDDLGRPAGMRGVTIDVTERKLSEEAVREAEEKYRSIFENAVEGIFQSLPDGRFISVNPAMARILGFDSPEEVIANRTDIAKQYYVDETSREDLIRTLDVESIVTGYECEVYRKDGSKIWTIENVRAIRDEHGEIRFYEGSIEDIAQRKQLEEQLQQSQKLEAIGQLAGGIAHDFNNLLTVINGYSDLALRRLDKDNPLRSSIEEIKKAGDRATTLTRQLLAFSRKQVLQPKVLKLNAIVEDVDKMLRRLIGEDVDLETSLDPTLGMIKADPGQIEQVIINLAVNACDAMPKGGKLTVETANVYLDNAYSRNHVSVQPGHYVMLALSDTGQGMAAEIQAKIFEPFFTTKESGKGTGLGLSTVYGIVKQSGGNIWVYSELGVGTTFKIYLPCVDEKVVSERPPDSLTDFSQGKGLILLAEDEDQVRKITRRILEMNGYNVLDAANGIEALGVFKENADRIDLVLTDAIMPKMGGPELAIALKRLSPSIKLLYMSGYTNDSIVRRGVLDQTIAFVEKPFTPEALVRKVREVLDAPNGNSK